MDYSNYYRQDDIDLKNIHGKIEIWETTGLMDGGTIFLHCKYEDKLFQIVSTQFTIIEEDETPEYLHLNANTIRIQSEEEKIILKLIKESVNTGESFWFLPKFMKSFPGLKKKDGYWIKIFKKEILNFANSKKYFQFLKMQVDLDKKEHYTTIKRTSGLSEMIKSMGPRV